MSLLLGHRERLFISILWLALIVTGFGRLFIYANTPGAPAQAGPYWPESSALKREPRWQTLVLFAHPRCPCSKASLGELARLMPHIKEKVRSYVVFFRPKDRSESWVVKDGLWRDAQSIPMVKTMMDEDGIEAARFGAKTSGQVLLFDEQGALVFRGGITPARGHMGDSDGRLAILSFVETGRTMTSITPVFGCSIRNPERAVAGEEK